MPNEINDHAKYKSQAWFARKHGMSVHAVGVLLHEIGLTDEHRNPYLRSIGAGHAKVFLVEESARFGIPGEAYVKWDHAYLSPIIAASGRTKDPRSVPKDKYDLIRCCAAYIRCVHTALGIGAIKDRPPPMPGADRTMNGHFGYLMNHGSSMLVDLGLCSFASPRKHLEATRAWLCRKRKVADRNALAEALMISEELISYLERRARREKPASWIKPSGTNVDQPMR